MASIHASIGTAHYRTEVRTDTNVIITDEPLSAGGEYLGFSPEELLAASLGACTAATLRMYADRKGWSEMTGVKVNVTFTRGPESSTMVRGIVLEGPLLSAEQKERLLVIANKCPLHQILTHPVKIETSLV